MKKKKIIELPSGVEQSVLADTIVPVSSIIRFVFLGRYERRKGIEELNKAIAALLPVENTLKVEFHFIGPIPEDKRLHNEKVIYHGEIRDKLRLQNMMRTCDILICPSWSEGMPNVILEAMANGLAVVATDVGATNILVGDKTGWLLKGSHVTEIYQTLNSILNLDQSAINKRKQAALNLIKSDFTWEKLIVKLYSVF